MHVDTTAAAMRREHAQRTTAAPRRAAELRELRRLLDTARAERLHARAARLERRAAVLRAAGA